jgi:2-polyprenyl-3-methyl-5-hydroxy-6-metoxy-1,4-benzoquinol methylase
VRLGAIAENPVEWVVARLGLAPSPFFDTQIGYTLARVVMVATRVGVFEAIGTREATPKEIADRCGTDLRATEKLLLALAGAGYVRAKGERYRLTSTARKWLLRESPRSLVDKMLFQFEEWEWLERSEDYLRSGEPMEAHSIIEPEAWVLYQRGMRSMAGVFAAEAVRRLPVPKHARDLLDIGGSHGYYSVELCRRHDSLRAVVLDLPAAIQQAAPLLAAEGMGDRVVHRAGDALVEDLGANTFDIVLIAQVVHHFTEAHNRDLARRVSRALRPAGVYAILDAFRAPSAEGVGQVGGLLEFYFALTSESGTWAPEQMADWQRQAGLRPRRPIRFRMTPGVGIQAAVKPG